MLSAFSQAWASWKRSPAVALLAIVAFALGIGSATAIVTIINGVLLRPLPYPDGERFVWLYGTNTSSPGAMMLMSVPELQDYQQQTTSFDAFGWLRTGRYVLAGPDGPQFVPGAAVTPALARELGAPLLGQWFADDAGAVVSSTFWRRLGGGADVVGRAITLDGRPYTITGVMPPAFQLPIASLGVSRGDTEVWIPLDPSPADTSRGSGTNVAYARRKPGVSLQQAQADARRVATIVAATDPQRYQSYTAGVSDLREATIGLVGSTVRAPLLILLGAAALLLLIACANVATLLLARSIARARDTAIRIALGASGRQIAMRCFAEGAIVAIAGAATGIALSVVLVRRMLTAASAFIPRAEDITLDWTVLGFSVAAALATGILVGVAPLWHALRTAPNAMLSEGVRASTAAPARRASKIFVVAEVALAFALLATSAILVVHMRNLTHAPLGFDPEGVVAFNLTLPRGDGTPEERAERRRSAQSRLMDALRNTPGITGAAFASRLPVAVCGDAPIYVDGAPPDASAPRACPVGVAPDFFSTMRIPLRSGRLLSDGDNQPRGAMPAVINEAAARVYWPGRTPLGAVIRLGSADNDPIEIVGIVGDVRNKGLNGPAAPEIYVPAAAIGVNPMNVVLRSDLPADRVFAAARRAIGQTDPALVMEDPRTIEDVVLGTLQLERLSSLVMTFFGVTALVMATVGIYGVVSYFVRQRSVELGTRLALGAVHRDLVMLVLGGGFKLAAAGVVAGSIVLVGGVWLLARYLEVTDVGWLPYAGSTTVVALVAGAASAVPAWRTTLLSPMIAIRDERPSVWQWTRDGVQRAVRDLRQAVAGTGDAEISPADVLAAFVDAARSADSYTGALLAALTRVCRELGVESAALLERHGAQNDYRARVAVGALDATAPVLAAEGFLIRRLRAYPRSMPLSSKELAALSEWAAAHRPDHVDEIRALDQAAVRLAVPLRTRREILGVLLFGERPQRAGYTAQEQQALGACADQFALMIENARLADRVVEQETLRRDIALASDVQRRLLPDAPPSAECADFAAISVPARRIGGDYYDFVELTDGRIGIALADVSGKGVPAALIMSVVQASLRIIASGGDVSPPALVARMNQFVHRSTPGSKYATFFYAELDTRHRRLRYVNAGHNAPFLLRASQSLPDAPGMHRVEELTIGGTVVGMFPDMDYEEATVELFPGDVLLAFTDGVPEAHNPDDEEFGEERLKQLLRETAQLPAGEISARIAAEMREWIRDAEQYDDLTFVVMKVR